MMRRTAMPGRLLIARLLTCLVAGTDAGAQSVPQRHAPSVAPSRAVHGTVMPGFERVRDAFVRNFDARGERGAAVAVWWNGRLVVDLWGGERDRARTPWDSTTLVPVFSTTKGLAALTVAVANARGWLDYDAPVARYWPEFAQQGKAAVTVRQLLAHEAGLVLFDQRVDHALTGNLDALAVVLARQAPRWPPGERHGYHLATLGFYLNELLRRVDPQHRSLARFFPEEVAQPAGVECWIGAPDTLTAARVAYIEQVTPVGGLLHIADPPFAVLRRMLWPWSTLTRTFAISAGFDVNAPRWWQREIASGLGLCSARALATMYGRAAEGGAVYGFTDATRAALESAPHVPPAGARDAVVGVDMYFHLGFLKPRPGIDWGTSRRAYGMPGAGGSFAFADPDRRLGYAYVMNRMGYHLDDDPRERALRTAVYAVLDSLDARR